MKTLFSPAFVFGHDVAVPMYFVSVFHYSQAYTKKAHTLIQVFLLILWRIKIA